VAIAHVRELREPRAEGRAFPCPQSWDREGTLLIPLPLAPLRQVALSGTSRGGRIRLQAAFSQLPSGFWDRGSPKCFPFSLVFSSDPAFGKRNFEPMLTVELCGTAGRTAF